MRAKLRFIASPPSSSAASRPFITVSLILMISSLWKITVSRPNTRAKPPTSSGMTASRRSTSRPTARARTEAPISTQVAWIRASACSSPRTRSTTKAATKATRAPKSTSWRTQEVWRTGGSGGMSVIGSVLESDQQAREGPGVERLQVLDALADPDQLDRGVRGLGHRHQHAAAGGAVQLGHHQARDIGGAAEDLFLLQRIAADGGVQHQKGFVRRLRIDLLQHPHDLEQLVHQLLLVLQAAGGVDQNHVVALGPGPGEGVEGQA